MDFRPMEMSIDLMRGYYRIDGVSINRFRTICCALGQLSLSDNNTLEQINLVLDAIKKETQEPISMHERNGGERAIFVVTLPREIILESNLEKAGFKMIYEFHRRSCYSERDMLKLWIISW